MSTIMVPNKVTIHCTDSPNGKPFALSELEKIHKARGFSSVGYHLVIQPSGEVERGRPLNQVGAHVQGHNTGNIGVCLVGSDKYTQAQWDSLRYQLDGLFLTFQIPKQNLFCHYQFDTAIKQGKTCPNVPINVILLWYYNVLPESVIAPYKIGG